jgi:hypothetical protein
LVKPPRAVFVNFPLGRQTGKPFNRQMQREIIMAALDLLETATEPGMLVTLPYEWREDGDRSWEGPYSMLEPFGR